MIELEPRAGTEAMSWSIIRPVPDVIGLHTARHRCGLSGYYDPLSTVYREHDVIIWSRWADIGSSPSNTRYSVERHTLDALAAPMTTRPPVSGLAPSWRELGRGLRWECERPSVRDSERNQANRVTFTSDRTAIVWSVLPNDHPRWLWPDGVTDPDCPLFYGREQDGGLTYTIRELVGPLHDRGVWVGHRLIARGDRVASEAAQVSLDARYTDAEGTRHTAPLREARLVTPEPVLVALNGSVQDVTATLATCLSSLLCECGNMAELVGSTWHGRASMSASGRFAFTGAMADGAPVRVGGQRSAESLAARLALFVA